MIFDHVLDSAFEDEEVDNEGTYRFPRTCEHCQRKITGKQYQIGKYFYDKYCYQFQWVIKNALEEEDRKIELKKKIMRGN